MLENSETHQEERKYEVLHIGTRQRDLFRASASCTGQEIPASALRSANSLGEYGNSSESALLRIGRKWFATQSRTLPERE